MATIRRHSKSGRWQVRYRDPDGRQRAKNFERKVDANKFMATVTADVYRGTYVDPHLGRTTVAEFAGQWQATRQHLAQATKDQDNLLLSTRILPRFGNRAVASLRQSEIAAWLSELDLAPSTKAKCLQKLAAILRLAVDDGAMKANPADRVSRPKVRTQREGRALSDSEIGIIINAAEELILMRQRWCGSWPEPACGSVKSWP
jgi:hypothetical protein